MYSWNREHTDTLTHRGRRHCHISYAPRCVRATINDKPDICTTTTKEKRQKVKMKAEEAGIMSTCWES